MLRFILLFSVALFSVGAFASGAGMAGMQAARILVSAYSHGHAKVRRLMPGPKGLMEIVYTLHGKTEYGWMTEDGQGFIPASTCVVDFYGPGVGDDLCDTVRYYHGHWRHIYKNARMTYESHHPSSR
ncbi:hypothetical protein B1757_13600 [Acidithiobacillus marinus]|uniref:Uncharacterized protein n=1 Tax=Acidithiobacillus marinus TaxID=187490 RepID=A0A2I1DID2_9PROT|nr:hypothetical protein [Acidithiobacillus marinus]PKY09634.1 hypothetical protein B1757_13600 [Acidithiobacillus marinus]